MNKKRSIDGFIPNQNSVKPRPGVGSRAGRGIPANALVENDEEIVKEIVPLPPPNGNNLRIKSYDDFVGARGAKKVKSTHTIEDFLDDSGGDDEGQNLRESIPKTRGGLLPDYEEVGLGEAELDDGLIDDKEEEVPTKKRSKLLFWQKDSSEEDVLGENEEIDTDEVSTGREDDFDIYNERPRQKSVKFDNMTNKSQVAKKHSESKDGDLDNDLDIDDDDIERYRSRRFKRENKDIFKDESNIALRVIGGAIIVVVTIIITYFVFTIFYAAPEPAKIGDADIAENTTDTEQPKSEEKPEEVAEVAPTIAVYNATTTPGAAAKLRDSLVASGKDAVVGTNNNGNTVLTGAGYAILDFTNGRKPKSLAEIRQLLGGVVETIEVISGTNMPADVQTDKDFVIIIR